MSDLVERAQAAYESAEQGTREIYAIASIRAAITEAVTAEREACAKVIEKLAYENGRQECCGHGVDGGGYEECCGNPVLVIVVDDAAAAIRARSQETQE